MQIVTTHVATRTGYTSVTFYEYGTARHRKISHRIEKRGAMPLFIYKDGKTFTLETPFQEPRDFKSAQAAWVYGATHYWKLPS